ncbi:N-6 DNA methylase [Duganella vulcania]|uniref:site-specific DNA-methyltransferase (adenine-specific) n=1 Tax=Duganella vulcania TaxID=2692166 RepID=A0A845GG33_9BURK|nr:N-6 DNA methylase [Duganella vulcania]MYM92362.1 N-6 DNA methylase [Duganella vulcania]
MKQDINDRQGQQFSTSAHVVALGNPPLPKKAKEHKMKLLKLIEDQSRRYHHRDVFIDFVTVAAIELARADFGQVDRREAIYMERLARYNKVEQTRFVAMLHELVEAMDACPSDILGEVYMEMGMGNARTGQYFTPIEMCKLMAGLTMQRVTQEKLDHEGHVRLHEPACGSGSMIIAAMEALRMRGINYQQHIHVTAIDLDPTAAKMAFIQLSLLHVPAVVIHGNTLTLQQFEVWYTPAHILDGWAMRLHRQGEQIATAAATTSASA